MLSNSYSKMEQRAILHFETGNPPEGQLRNADFGFIVTSILPIHILMIKLMFCGFKGKW
jgi:hypothetical protein